MVILLSFSFFLLCLISLLSTVGADSGGFFFFFFDHVEAPGPVIEPVPQQWLKSQK